MIEETVIVLIDELASFREASHQPFPSADCDKLVKGQENVYIDFAADLNTYNMSISAPVDWGSKIVEWTTENIQRFLKYTEQAFFEKFPRYQPLAPLVTEIDTPNLYANIQLHEKIRTSVRKLLLKLLVLAQAR